jgi:hypothetical protein
MMKPDWHKFEPIKSTWGLPPTKRYVLLQFPADEQKGLAPAVVVGYLKYDTMLIRDVPIKEYAEWPYFITPGFDRQGRSVSYWADCLGDDFNALPSWQGAQSK